MSEMNSISVKIVLQAFLNNEHNVLTGIKVDFDEYFVAFKRVS